MDNTPVPQPTVTISQVNASRVTHLKTWGKSMISQAAYSPDTKLFYVPTNHVCMDYEPYKVSYTAGQAYVGAAVASSPAFLALTARSPTNVV